MTKIKKISGIELDYPLFIKEEYSTTGVQAKTFQTIGGGIIVYERVKRENSNYLTLISKDSGWVSKDKLREILYLGNSLGVQVNLLTLDGGIIQARFAHENGDFLKTEDVIHENGKWFKVEIALCKI